MTRSPMTAGEKAATADEKPSLSFELQGFINGLRFSEGWDHAKYIDRIQAAIPRIKALEIESSQHTASIAKVEAVVKAKRLKQFNTNMTHECFVCYEIGFDHAVKELKAALATPQVQSKEGGE
jgi:hypothetical protein